ncbi:hypothetical protein PMI26_01833 [Pseudomonas sp. GM33]|uniref:hypothetical protein n=1 Tax=Pseudomonas sp. GM33 TaxID=1144329 RepID=UPI00027022F7|nr:hypothetical protein [Pseudomonas sp. GM33]EJM44834.1 hypothetical protein PMI26_01833 [Pseudomonas sp. GM33]
MARSRLPVDPSTLQSLKTPVDLLGLPPAITEVGNHLYRELAGAGRAQDLGALALEEARADGFLLGLQAARFGEVVDHLRTEFTAAGKVARTILG